MVKFEKREIEEDRRKKKEQESAEAISGLKIMYRVYTSKSYYHNFLNRPLFEAFEVLYLANNAASALYLGF